MIPNPTSHDSEPVAVIVHLLDPIAGRPMQSWKFESKFSLTIGRDEDRDISITHPYVSRNHAELQFRSGQWMLIAYGRNGVHVNGQSITEYAISGSVDFRLGAKGPQFRFQNAEPEKQSTATLSFDPEDDFVFSVDEDKVKREVAEIAEGDYFQNLQNKAKLLKRPHTSND